MMSSSVPARRPVVVAPEELSAQVTDADAAAALRGALLAGFDPADDHDRRSEHLTGGSLLLMPSEVGSHAGIKVLSMAPDNPARGLDLIQGTYLLFDADTLALTHVIDGPALTDLRTPAMTMVALRPALVRFDGPLDVVLVGTGHQGRAHVRALRAELEACVGTASVTALARRPEAVPADEFDQVLALGSAAAERALAEAHIVMCATPAVEPLFDGSLLRRDVVLAAVGSHTPQARELDAGLLGRAEVVVEDVATVLREGGDVIQAIDEGALTAADLHPVRDVVRGSHTPDATKPYLFKGVGMPWQDLVVAAHYARATGERPGR